MPVTTELTAAEQKHLERLRQADRRELKWLFGNLSAPDLQSLEGEFDAELLSQGGKIADKVTAAVFRSNGPWIGKAFRPVGPDMGEGYNCFQYGDQVVPKLFMKTTLAKSNLAEGQSMVIDYSTQNRGLIRWLVGEFRMVSDTVILGFGIFGPRSRCRWNRKIPFAMVGPRRSYQSIAG